MGKSKRKADIKIREADIRKAEWFGSITAAFIIILCILFMGGVLQKFWVLNFIQIGGILLNLAVFLVSVVRKNPFVTVFSLLLLVAEAASIVYFLL
ncbi:MAG: hypothetical protein LUF35_00280 [Lachnospiraceae bacterium]|nr:hypothetical protein [Lachnospiraceae bacterium]